MASVSFDASVVDHTLPTYFAGIGAADFRSSNDFYASSYRASLQDLNPEIIRLNPWHSGGTVASPNTTWQAMVDLCTFLGSSVAVSLGYTTAHPSGKPSSQSPASISNIEGNGGGRSPSDQADWFGKFIDLGINVLWFEPYNEPTNCAGTTNGDGPWYDTLGAATSLGQKKCESWAWVHHRLYQQAVASKAAAKGVATPRIAGGVIGDTEPYAQTWMKNFMSGTLIDGSTWPWGDDNFAYFDTYVAHPYPHGTTSQGQLNSVFWDPATFTTNNDNVCAKSFVHNLRTYMDAQGHTDKMVSWNEAGMNDTTALAGLCDVAYGILAMGWQALYKIDYFAQWSLNCGTTSSPRYPMCDQATHTLYTRFCAMRDLVFYTSRNYKRVVGFGQAGGNTPSSGESNGLNNSVPRIVWVAALNADGSKMSILVANIDLTNSESFTATWTGGSSTGDATYRQLLQSTTTTGSTRLPSGTQTVGSGVSTFTRTIEAGAAYLFEIPLTGAPAAPTNTVAPSISGTTQVGSTLSTSTGTWTGSPTFTYQWKRGGTAVTGATTPSYSLTGTDLGANITVTVTGTNAGGSASATSSAVGPITSPPAPHRGSGKRIDLPSAPNIDAFERADGPAGGSYASIQGTSTLPTIVSNALTNASSTFQQFVYTTSFAADQEVWVAVGGDNYYDLFVRYDQSSNSGYMAEYESDTNNVNVYKVTGVGAFTLLAAGVNTGRGLISGLDILGLKVVGSTITSYLNGLPLQIITDSTYNRIGDVGVGLSQNGGSILCLGGGPVSTTRAAGTRQSGTRVA